MKNFRHAEYSSTLGNINEETARFHEIPENSYQQENFYQKDSYLNYLVIVPSISLTHLYSSLLESKFMRIGYVISIFSSFEKNVILLCGKPHTLSYTL